MPVDGSVIPENSAMKDVIELAQSAYEMGRRAGIAEERERCAKIAEEPRWWCSHCIANTQIAKLIRSGE